MTLDLYKQGNMTKKSPCSPLRVLDNMANGVFELILAENKQHPQLLLQQTTVNIKEYSELNMKQEQGNLEGRFLNHI